MKLPKTYRMDVVDGKLVITGPSNKVQKPVPQPVRVEATPPATNECKQCKQPFIHKERPYPPQLYCGVKCRKKYQNKKKYENRRSAKAKRDGATLVSSCLQCNEDFTYVRLKFGRHKKFCGKACRNVFHKNKYNAKKVKTQKKAPLTKPVEPVTEGRTCPQCATAFSRHAGRGQPKKYCTAACREKWFNNKYKQERKERLAKATVHTFHCRLCKKEAVKQKGNQVYCSPDCREIYYSNLNKRVLGEPVEKLHGGTSRAQPSNNVVRRSYTLSYKTCRRCSNEFAPSSGAQKTCFLCKEKPPVGGVCKNPNCSVPFQKKGQEEYCSVACVCAAHTGKTTPKSGGKVAGTFMAKVNEALATLPSEETLPPPMPEDRSAGSLLSAGRTLTEVGLAEGVKDTYGVEIKDQPLRARGFWFSILLAKHSKDLKDWRTKLEKHGFKSKPSVEKWLLFRGASATTASASGLKSRLEI